MVGIELVEIQISQVVVGNVLRNHVVNGDQDLMGNRHRRSLVSTSCLEAVELVAQIGSFRSGGGVSGFH